ncbi:MAG TPA: hypothetical protein VGQ83_09855 [Polyangia bacterium]|jgi:hypothetical protein
MRPVLVAAAALLLTASARADDGSVEVVVDAHSRLQTVVPRRHAAVRMAAEEVRIIPFFDRARGGERPIAHVDARFDFVNLGPATRRPGPPRDRRRGGARAADAAQGRARPGRGAPARGAAVVHAEVRPRRSYCAS